MPWILLLLLSSAQAESLRCGNAVIDTGDLAYTVRSKCGAPDSVEKYTAPDYGVYYWYDRRRQPVRQGDIGVKEVWLYDRGSNRLNARVIFINGEVSQIDTLGYGGK
ncbi:DUF2845 domain-containing protein [Andreprevotia sp. IGB-42]|uniref:DUF2845 domain-containing protein n=1 Tax=Andreprevotia sp. IGB-42 TaxID=2497473 RepID=UPI00135AAC76|nr:DUF2845 domain-containing protein [Andreprevotia sp. IGB-42]